MFVGYFLNLNPFRDYCARRLALSNYNNLLDFFLFSLVGKGGSVSNKLARSADKFQFEDIFSGRFSPQPYTCDWISGRFSIFMCFKVHDSVYVVVKN